MLRGGTGRRIRFNGYEADLDAGQLRKHGSRINLREKSFQVLASLLESPGKVVTREDLRRRLWPQDVFVDFDNNLNTAVARLREVLGDSAERPRFIETLPKRGYRFVARVSDLARIRQPTAAHRIKLVVLPFLNLSGDPSEEYFSEGMTEEIITELAGLAPEQVAVIARTTAMHYKGSPKDVSRIGRELGVDHVVEGSVRRTEDQVEMNVQLVQTSDQTHVWAKRYDVELRDIFATQSEIARAIGVQLGVGLGSQKSEIGTGAHQSVARKPIDDLKAYNLYLEGRYHLYKCSPEAIVKARQCFEEAIARDPEFALAYDSLAELHWFVGFLGYAPPKEVFSVGVWAALRAVEIDHSLAETHALLGMYRKELDYNWSEVRREMDRARELNPMSPIVRFRYALSGLMPMGRVQEAAAEIECALESDPLSVFMRCWLSVMLWLARQYDYAIEQARAVIELDPLYYVGHFAMGQCCRDKQMLSESIGSFQKATELSGGSPLMLGWLGHAMAQGGNPVEARAVLERLRGLAREMYVPPSSFAWIHLGLGEIDNAFEGIEQAIDARDPMIIPIKSYPFLDPIRSDRRYLALLHKMNLEAD